MENNEPKPTILKMINHVRSIHYHLTHMDPVEIPGYIKGRTADIKHPVTEAYTYEVINCWGDAEETPYFILDLFISPHYEIHIDTNDATIVGIYDDCKFMIDLGWDFMRSYISPVIEELVKEQEE